MFVGGYTDLQEPRIRIDASAARIIKKAAAAAFWNRCVPGSENGQIIKSFEEIPEQPEGDHYTIITTSEYLGQRGYRNSPDLSLVDKTDYLKIKQLAISLSKKDKKGIYLVCKNNDNIYWH